MKTKSLFGTFLFLLFSFNIINAQEDKYSSAMKEALAEASDSSSVSNMPVVISKFERIAQAEQNKWLPYYYAAYFTIIHTLGMKDAPLREQLLDHAQTMLDQTLQLSGDSSEIMVVQGLLYIGRLQVDPMTRGAQYSQMANNAYDKAIKLNPLNPRAYYMKGVTILHTPEFFGGGKEPAKPLFAKAMELFENFKPAAPFYPDWGKENCTKQMSVYQ